MQVGLLGRTLNLRRGSKTRNGDASSGLDARHAPLSERVYRYDVQGLRAIAVLIVVLDHAGVGFMKGGYVGVDCFFVLSGFLITGLLLSGAEKRGYVSFVDFYIRRAKRILPAATFTLVVTMTAAYYLLNEVRARQAIWDSIFASFFTANFRFAHQATDYFAQDQPPSPIQHYWSLSVEEQFYFVWPALLALTLFGVALGRRAGGRRKSRREIRVTTGWKMWRLFFVLALAAATSLAWSIYYTHTQPAAAYFSTLARVWELAFGAMLAIGAIWLGRLGSASRVALGWAGLIAIVVASVMYSGTTEFPGFAALLPTLGTVLVIAAGTGTVQPRLAVGRMLATPPLRYLGDRSYALYLWHWPVLIIATQYVGHDLALWAKLALLMAAFLLSIVSYATVENPIRRARWRTPASAVLVPVSGIAVAAVAVFTLTSISARLLPLEPAYSADTVFAKATASNAAQVPPLSAVVSAVKAARRGAPIPSALIPPPDKLLDSKYIYNFPSGCVPAGDSETTSNICRLGDADSSKTLVVFGDSHAQMLMPIILAMANRDGWAVIPLVKSRCQPSAWLDGGYPRTPAAILRYCHAWYAWASRKAESLHPDVVVMTGCCGANAGSPTTDRSKHGFVSLAKALKSAAKSVVLVADNVGVNKQPVDCILARNATMRTCTTKWPAEWFEFNKDLAAMSKSKGFVFMNTVGWFCFERECPMAVGHTIVYRDTGHITVPYALQLAAPFRTMFRRCIFDTCPR